MKLILRIFNIVIMAISLIATVFLFASPSFSFNSKIVLDIDSFSQFVPENEFTRDLDFVDLLGTDSIQVRIKFSLYPDGVSKIMNGDREIINDEILAKNIDEIVGIIHEPVDLITELAIRNFLETVITNEITFAVDEARQKYDPDGVGSSTQEIMDEVGMDEAYFHNFAYALYDSANKEDATTDSVGEDLYEQIDSALATAEESGMVDTSSFTDEKKEDLKTYFVSVLHDMNLIEEDGVHIRPIGMISYIYMIDFLKQALDGKVEASVLAQKSDENIPEYSDRLLNTYVITMMPEIVYQIVGYISLGLFIGLFVFAGVWALLFVITLLRTFTKKPWTVFGFWFWPIGSLQLVLGLGLTMLGKVILPSYNVLGMLQIPIELPIKTIILAPRTYALVPSLLFLGVMILAIVYGIFKRVVKHQVKEEEYDEKFDDDEDDENEEDDDK